MKQIAIKLLSLFLVSTGGIVGAGLLLSLLSPAVQAAGINFFVKTNGSGTTCSQASPCLLTTALTQAVSGDNIYVAAGTYTGTGNAVISLMASVALYGGWDGAGSGGIVRNPSANVSILDGQNQRRVIYINASLTPTIDGFQITRGTAVDQPDEVWTSAGAGIFGNNTNPIISNNFIKHNTILTGGTPAGAGIYLFNASASSQIKGNTIFSNTSGTGCGGYGGGILLDSSSTVVRNNTLTQNCAGVGAALTSYHVGSPVITGNLFLKNTGAGVYVVDSSALIQDNQILSNTGPGVYIYRAPVTVDRNEIAYNKYTTGAGIFSGNEGTQLFTVTNNIIYSNTASVSGGGFYIYASTYYPSPGAGVLLHNTFAKNSPAGIYADTYTILTLTTNIIVSHTVGICAGTGITWPFVHADHTLFYNNTAGNTDDGGGPCLSIVTSTNAITGLAPLFVNEAIGNLHLKSNSPAIDAGTPTGITKDYDGQTRVGLPDIGADEFIYFLSYLPLIMK